MALLQPSSVFSFYYHQGCVSHRRLRVDRPASLHSSSIKLIGQQISNGNNISVCWSFLRGSKIPNFRRNTLFKRRINCKIHNFHEGILTSEIASTAFTWGTAAVLPFYTFMIVAPKAQITKKIVGSSLPYVLLGMLYAYLLYLSWTPDIVGLIFASKYWMPELSGMANLFSREMTLASAWIHLLVVDLFTARQVYHDGLKHNIETRHSVCFCLLCCPIGILAHNITKAISRGESNIIDGLD